MGLAWNRRTASGVALGLAITMVGCGDVGGMDPGDPARGPGQLVGNGPEVSDGNFAGGNDTMPSPREVPPPAEVASLDCNADCRAYCDGLGLENPVNVGLCGSAWGVGLALRPVDRAEACRRIYADFVGRFPTPTEIAEVCDPARPWGDVVKDVLATDEYVLVNQRRWADKLLYNNRAVNFERAWDMDELVGKTYRGRVSWDQFAAVTSAHPVIMRRLDTAGDRAEFMFKLFLGRPPYEHERSDLARLYQLWTNGYWNHPHVGTVPDAFVDFRCVRPDGSPDPDTIGECTSIQWGYQELTLAPDPKRAERTGEQEGTMWAGYLTASEWQTLQAPGRIIAREPAFWETTVDDAIDQYFGYDLAAAVPEVRHELVRYLLRYNGDVRALHFAIGTSFAYLQSSEGASATDMRWTYGPLKQIQVEGWIDTIKRTTGVDLAQCDHRLPHPEDYVGEDAVEEASGWAYALVNHSRWDIDGDERRVIGNYRGLARTLGGCPSNEVGGRFTTVSVLNTAVQEAFVAEVCGIGDGSDRSIDIERLLPDGITPRQALDADTARAILTHQQRMFLGRSLSEEETALADSAATSCTPAPCDAETFARPACFALLSSSEMLFY